VVPSGLSWVVAWYGNPAESESVWVWFGASNVRVVFFRFSWRDCGIR